MLVTCIQVIDSVTAKQQIDEVIDATDALELRLDYLQSQDLSSVAKLRQQYPLPMIFTLRHMTQGGFYPYDEATRRKTLLSLCAMGPDYLDCEFDLPETFIQHLHQCFPAIRLIHSYHNLSHTPPNLSAILARMQQPYFYAYKIATHANTSLDVALMLRFIARYATSMRLTGIAMGALGRTTRLLSPVLGNAFHYTCPSTTWCTAAGQIPLSMLRDTYRCG